MALFDDRAATDVWGKDNSTLIASTYMPTGRATPVEGGYRFSGKWKFSSGVEHCEWVFLGGLTAKDKIKELVLYSISEEFFAVRAQRGLTIAG